MASPDLLLELRADVKMVSGFAVVKSGRKGEDCERKEDGDHEQVVAVSLSNQRRKLDLEEGAHALFSARLRSIDESMGPDQEPVEVFDQLLILRFNTGNGEIGSCPAIDAVIVAPPDMAQTIWIKRDAVAEKELLPVKAADVGCVGIRSADRVLDVNVVIPNPPACGEIFHE